MFKIIKKNLFLLSISINILNSGLNEKGLNFLNENKPVENSLKRKNTYDELDQIEIKEKFFKISPNKNIGKKTPEFGEKSLIEKKPSIFNRPLGWKLNKEKIYENNENNETPKKTGFDNFLEISTVKKEYKKPKKAEDNIKYSINFAIKLYTEKKKEIINPSQIKYIDGLMQTPRKNKNF